MTDNGLLGQDAREPTVSLLEVATFLLRHRRLTLWAPMLAALIVGVVLSFTPVTYTSSASFMPQQSKFSSSLSGLAAQFGVAVPRNDQQDSPAFYADLVKSREVLKTVLYAAYALPSGTGRDSATLMSVLDIRGKTPELRLEKALHEMNRLVSVDLSTRTGIISISVAMPNRVLAQEVAQRLLDEVNRFNLEQRQSQASAERKFTEGRLGELRGELRQAEDSLQQFLQRNVTFANSPALTFQQQRLARVVDLRQAMFTTVAQEYEKARIVEVRDTPVITVIEQPNLPARRDGRGRLRYGLLALIAVGVLGSLAGLAQDYWKRQRTASTPEFGDLSSLMGDTRHDLAGTWAIARRVVGWKRPG